MTRNRSCPTHLLLTLLACLTGGCSTAEETDRAGSEPNTVGLRLATYNIKHGLGMDGRIDLERTAVVLAALATRRRRHGRRAHVQEAMGGEDHRLDRRARLCGLSDETYRSTALAAGLAASLAALGHDLQLQRVLCLHEADAHAPPREGWAQQTA